MRGLLRRAWAWFLGRRHYEIAVQTADGCMVSQVSRERYKLIVRPAGDRVQLGIHCTSHRWLRHLASVEPMGGDVLVVEAAPDDIPAAREALIAEADRRVQAIKAAWEHGWRPGV